MTDIQHQPEYASTPVKNNEIRKIIAQQTNIDGYGTKIPVRLKNNIQPVVSVGFNNKYCDIVLDNGAVNTTSVTIYTTPTDRDFYLCSCSLSVIKDVNSTSTNSNIGITVNGNNTFALIIPEITLTVQNSSLSCSFPNPLKIDRGTNITVNNSTNVANISARAVITGFTYQQDVTSANYGELK